MNHKLPALIALILSTQANANVITVMNINDFGPGSLRDAVASSVPGDTINFDPGVAGTIVLGTTIAIPHTLYVLGPGAGKLAVSGNSADRVFTTTGNPVLISGLTIQDGLWVGSPGADGALCQDGIVGAFAGGGGILAGFNNADLLILSNCWLTENTVRGGQGGRGGDGGTPVCVAGKGGFGGNAAGGGLYVQMGNAFAVNCTFSGNHVIGGHGGNGGHNLGQPVAAGSGGQGGSGQGGGADVFSASSPGFTNCTFSGNDSTGGVGGDGGTNIVAFPGGNGGNGGLGSCGGLSCFSVNLISCTIVSNTATGAPGGNGGFGMPFGINGTTGPGDTGGICGYSIICPGLPKVGNTIIADNFATTSHSNAYLGLTDLGFNYFGDDKDLCAGPSSRMGTVSAPLHPQLAPLAQNGGSLPTHAPRQGSPVIDWGNAFGTTTDERRAPRPFGSPAVGGGDGSDIGAFEFGSTPLGGSIGGGTNGPQILITWPACYGDFTLQSSSNLFLASSWMNVTDTPAVVGDLFVVTNIPVGLSRFYRLIHP